MDEQNQYFDFPVTEGKYILQPAIIVPQETQLHGHGGFALDRQPSNASSHSQASLSSANCFSTPTSPINNNMYSHIKYEYEPNSTPRQYDTSLGNYYQPETVRHTPKSLAWTHNTELLKLYTFVVPKNQEPYFQLLDKWTPTYETPTRVYLDERPKGFKKDQFPCLYPATCNGKQNVFGRPADLARHYKNVHADVKDSFMCDYPKCPRSHDPFGRKDHCRDHYKQFHKEDIGCATGEKGAKGKNSRKWQQAQKIWLSERNNDSNWWRCARCLIRNYISEVGWVCPSCKGPCEEERRAAREGRAAAAPEPYANTVTYQTCGTCNGEAWIDNGCGSYMLCRSCQCQPSAEPAQEYQYENPVYGFAPA